ncbi:hypothetical protein [Streptomyces sp. NPDC002994]
MALLGKVLVAQEHHVFLGTVRDNPSDWRRRTSHWSPYWKTGR